MGCVYAERYVCAYSSKAALLQYNLHTIKFTHLRYTVHCFLCVCFLFFVFVYSQCCATVTQSNSRTFSST